MRSGVQIQHLEIWGKPKKKCLLISWHDEKTWCLRNLCSVKANSWEISKSLKKMLLWSSWTFFLLLFIFLWKERLCYHYVAPLLSVLFFIRQVLTRIQKISCLFSFWWIWNLWLISTIDCCIAETFQKKWRNPDNQWGFCRLCLLVITRWVFVKLLPHVENLN